MMEEKPIPNYAGYLGTPFGELRPRRTYTANQCRYIAAEPPGPAYLACGTETDVGESWCYHCKGIMSARSGLTDEERALRIKQARGAAALAAAQRTIDHEMLRDAA